MSELRIEKVKTKRDLKKFILFPWKIYKNDPNWVPPLIMDIKGRLDKKKNPFFEHADMELFLAYQGSEIVGRIAAILDENHNKVHNEKVIFFGLYESFNDVEVAEKLLETVAEWGKKRGMTVLRGPMNLSMNDECAFLLEGFDSPPVIMMTYNPPYYLELMEKCGQGKAKDLYAFYMSRDHEIAQKVKGIVDKAQAELNVTLRKVNIKKLDEEAKKIAFIYNSSWEKNWGFVPWTDKEMEYMTKMLKQFADPSLVIFAEDQGKPIGFAFGLPNYNEVIIKMNGRLFPLGIIKFMLNRKKIKGMRGVVFGVLKEYRHTGLSYLLYSELEKNAIEKGYEWGELSWQLEDNEPINRFAASVGAKIYKKYRIYEKKIA
jgi:GNAT superfamily N-acetyltransferase